MGSFLLGGWVRIPTKGRGMGSDLFFGCGMKMNPTMVLDGMDPTMVLDGMEPLPGPPLKKVRGGSAIY